MLNALHKFRTFRKGGIHPPENKLTAGDTIEQMPMPDMCIVPLSQHIGAAADCCVAVGDHVARYQLIAKGHGFVSANVHSPISGVVKKIEMQKNALGFDTKVVVIQREGDDVMPLKEHTAEEVEALTAEDILNIIDEAGIVGLGGATFPTRVKLTPPKNMPVDTLVINGAECEPFLTNDHRLMVERPDEIIAGVRLLMRTIHVKKGIIAIERNKPDAIKALKEAAGLEGDVEIATLQVKYPQGGEKQLIDAVLGRQIPPGGLPASVGVVVQNVATAYAVWNAVFNGIPLVERVVTITGLGLKHTGNFVVQVGTPITDLIKYVGGLPEDTGKVILGGPMMGKAVSNLNASATKGMSGVLIVPRKYAERKPVENCVRCGACVSVCPMGLEPFLLARLSEAADYDRLEAEHVTDCIECGSCSFICMSHRPILDYIRMGKTRTIAIIKARNMVNKQ